jgi:pimeloyl-ACP methyl ester carboxylesterase
MRTAMRLSHFIRAGTIGLIAALAAVALAGRPLGAQAPAATSTFTVFLRSTPIGNEQVSVERSNGGWTISGSGRVGPPLNLVLRSFQVRYDVEWRPMNLRVDSTLGGRSSVLETNVANGTARNELTPLGGPAVTQADPVDPRALFLPNLFVAPWEAFAARLKSAAPGESFAVYRPGQGSFSAKAGESTMEQIKTVERLISARRTRVTFELANAPPLDVEIWGDEGGRLLRVRIPVEGLEFAREDIASVSARLVTISRPNDEDIRIPGNGFSLAGTVSKPANAAGRLPAVVLIGPTRTTDRDETAFGIPIFGELSAAIADAGFVVLRYDKRGVGQSGGRTEAARLTDFADDAKAAIKTMSERKDVDRRRLAVVGHAEGGWLAMLAAAGNGRVSAVGLMATAGVTGQELNLYQVVHGLERSGRPESERQATTELQKKIQQAVITGKGWEYVDIPAPTKRQAETPYFQSFLTFDPAKVMKDLDQPVLILHGALDMETPVSNADRLETLAKARKKATVETVKVPAVNHLLAAATTGEQDEYPRLTDRRVSGAITRALVEWLQRTMSTGSSGPQPR